MVISMPNRKEIGKFNYKIVNLTTLPYNIIDDFNIHFWFETSKYWECCCRGGEFISKR